MNFFLEIIGGIKQWIVFNGDWTDAGRQHHNSTYVLFAIKMAERDQ